MSMDSQPTDHINSYPVHALLGDGGQAKVYLCSRNAELVAIKVYDSGSSRRDAFKKEVEFLQMLECSHIIRLIEWKLDAVVKLDGGEACLKPIIVLEYAAKGEIFDLISNGKGGLKAEICRAVVKRLLNALELMHQKGVTHRDLKLQNILLDINFDVKVSDLGLSTPLQGADGDGVLRSKVGTEGFRPPEMERGNYTGAQADIFALGVIIFMLYAGSPPFLSTKTSDKVYKRIRQNRFDSFWILHEKKKEEGFYCDEFKRLMNSFFNLDPQKRPTFESLRDNEWLNGQVSSQEQLQIEFEVRHQKALEEDERKAHIFSLVNKLTGAKTATSSQLSQQDLARLSALNC